MIERIKVYTASKLSEAPLWHKLRDEWPEIMFIARWPFLHVGTIPDTPTFAKVFWEQDLKDVKAADVVMVYARAETDKLKGALVEAGAGLALGKQIVIVGSHPDYGTWQFHRDCHRVKDLEEARQLLQTMNLSL